MKQVIFLGNVEKVIDSFSTKAKQRIAAALNAIRTGLNLSPSDFKYMPTIGTGVYELRIKTDKQYRVFYITKYNEAVYILHAFVKKTQQTALKDIELGKARYKVLVNKTMEK